jgi:hypothetical protein
MMSVRDRLAELGGPFPRRVSAVDRAAALVRRPLDRRALRSLAPLHQARRLGDSVAAADVPVTGPRVLVLALRGWPNHCALETTIAQALRLRGADVALLTCGGGQPACEMGWGREAFPRPCDRCAWYTGEAVAASGLRAFRLVDAFAWGADGRRAPQRPLPAMVDPRWAGEVSVPWFLKATHTESIPDAPQAWRDYAVAASAVEASATAVLDEFAPDALVALNGLFSSERVVRELALARGIAVATYEMGPRLNTLFFSSDEPACDYDTTRLWAQVKDRPLTPPQRDAITTMLAARVAGHGAHESYFDTTVDDEAGLRAELGLAPGRRVLSLFTNISWDSAALGHDVGFASMIEWIAETARMASGLEDADLVVRIHPGEARWGTNEDVEAAVRERLGEVPANVRIVPAARPLNSYALLGLTDLALVYTTTVGLEAANLGVPVAVAGATHYRDRGFTHDVEGPEQQLALMRATDLEVDAAQRELALRYAFTFFFRALIPFGIVPQGGGGVVSLPVEAGEIAPGADPYLDLVCDRILDGGLFAVPDELVELG